MPFNYLCGKRLHKGGEVWLYGGADYTAYQPCNKQRRIYEHRHASILRHGLYDVSMVQGGGVVLHHRKYSVRNCRQKEVKTAYTTESLLSITTGRAGFFAI